MKRLLVAAAVAAAVLGMAPSANAQATVSQGCTALNRPHFDAVNTGTLSIGRTTFNAGETITASATELLRGTAPTTISFAYGNVIAATAPFPGELTYTVPATGPVDLLVFFSNNGAAILEWNIGCIPADTDGDGANDGVDNCPTVRNADQANNDGDLQGDACDADDDNDNVADTTDNCQFAANADQLDADGDGKGAACDTQELPLSKDDCQDGGWQRFDGTATFANQGQCMRFVATGGKTPPAS